MGYATTTTGKREHTKVTKDSKCMWSGAIGGNIVKVVQRIITTEEEYFGLSYENANTIATVGESSILNGTTRNYLGDIQLNSGFSFYRIDGCWGTKTTSTLNRMSDTNYYHVVKITQQISVQNYGGTMTYL